VKWSEYSRTRKYFQSISSVDHEASTIFHYVIFQAKGWNLYFLNFSCLRCRAIDKQLHLRNPHVSAWRVFAAVVGNEPRSDVKNPFVQRPSCRFASCQPFWRLRAGGKRKKVARVALASGRNSSHIQAVSREVFHRRGPESISAQRLLPSYYDVLPTIIDTIACRVVNMRLPQDRWIRAMVR
jgi:hypothetical protein